MTWAEWGGLAAAASGATTVVGFVMRNVLSAVKTIRENDMKHLDAKMDVLGVKIDQLRVVGDRTEKKIDHHIEWHLESK